MSTRPAFRRSLAAAGLAAAVPLISGCSDPTNDGSAARSAPAGTSATAPAASPADPVSIGGMPITRPATPPAPAPEAVGSAELAAANADPRVAAFSGLRAPKPATWSWQPPSGMRAGTWTIPGRSGGDFATLTAFVGILGGAESNIQRWIGQFRPAEGGEPLAPERWTEEVPGVGTASMVRLSGRFRGMGSVFEAGQTLLGVVIDPSPIGPVQLKLVGPTEVVAAADADFLAFVRGLRLAADFQPPSAAPAEIPAPPAGAGADAGADADADADAAAPGLPLAYFKTSGDPEARLAHHVALEGRPAPAITVTDPRLGDGVDVSPADATTITLEDLRGRIVVVDFWGTWCAPCMAAIPKNITLQSKHADDGVVFLGVHSTIAPGETMDAAADRLGISYPVAMDVSRTSEQAWGIKGWPFYAIVGRDGTVLAAGLKSERVGDALAAVIAAGA